MSLRIGIDATSWGNRRGFGRHTRGLLGAIPRVDSRNRYVFVCDARADYEALPAGVERRLVRSGSPAAVAASANGRRSVGDLWRMSHALSDRSFDVVFFPTIYSYVPVWSRARKLVGVHDVTGELHPGLVLAPGLPRIFWRLKVRLGHAQANAILTVSEHSRRGLVEHLGLSRERVFVAGEASDPVFRRIPGARPTPRLEGLGLADENASIVYVGGFSPHKGLDALVEAFGEIAGDDGELRLVLVGDTDEEVFVSCYPEICRRVSSLGLEGRVTFTGHLPDEDLAVLLNRATVLVLPSVSEGLGLPALEAAACGCPVIATEESAIPDLLGEAALYVRPRDTRGLAEALRRVLGSEDLRERMGAAGAAAARGLSWEKAAGDVVRAIEEVAAR